MGLDHARCEEMLHIPVNMLSPVVAEPLTRTIGDNNKALWAMDRPGQSCQKTQSSLIRQAEYGEVLYCIKSRTWDQRKRSLFTVEGCSPKANRAISPMVKYMRKTGPGKSVHYKEVFTNQGCSL